MADTKGLDCKDDTDRFCHQNPSKFCPLKMLIPKKCAMTSTKDAHLAEPLMLKLLMHSALFPWGWSPICMFVCMFSVVTRLLTSLLHHITERTSKLVRSFFRSCYQAFLSFNSHYWGVHQWRLVNERWSHILIMTAKEIRACTVH